jgi:hypothetical protein
VNYTSSEFPFLHAHFSTPTPRFTFDGSFTGRTPTREPGLAPPNLCVPAVARKRSKLTPLDRLFWVFLTRFWSNWRSTLVIVKPETVVAWHRKCFRLFWTWKVRTAIPDARSFLVRFGI